MIPMRWMLGRLKLDNTYKLRSAWHTSFTQCILAIIINDILQLRENGKLGHKNFSKKSTRKRRGVNHSLE